MSNRLDYACELRNNSEKHYNCCQAVLTVFCDDCNIDAKLAYALGAHFGGGMKVGATCGALTGALMVMGMLNSPNQETQDFINNFEEKHGNLNCSKLLLKVDENLSRQKLCSNLITDCITEVEAIV